MKSLLENILDSDKKTKSDLQLDSQKMLAAELLKKFTHRNVDNKQRDGVGREIKEGDIVLYGAMFNPRVVVNLNVHNRKNDIVIYDPISHTEKIVTMFEVFKLENPEKYLK